MPLARRVELLDEVIAGTAAVAPGWVARECERKHVFWGSSVAGEEWWNGPWCALRAARRLRAELTRSEQDDRAAGWVRVATVHRDDSVSSIPFVETIETLFGEGQLVLLQLSTGSLAPVVDRALHPVINEGYVRIVTGEPVTESGSVTRRSCFRATGQRLGAWSWPRDTRAACHRYWVSGSGSHAR